MRNFYRLSRDVFFARSGHSAKAAPNKQSKAKLPVNFENIATEISKHAAVGKMIAAINKAIRGVVSLDISVLLKNVSVFPLTARVWA